MTPKGVKTRRIHHLSFPAPGHRCALSHSTFSVGAGNQDSVLTLAQQVPYPMSHLPNPMVAQAGPELLILLFLPLSARMTTTPTFPGLFVKRNRTLLRPRSFLGSTLSDIWELISLPINPSVAAQCPHTGDTAPCCHGSCLQQNKATWAI